jgi:hypothetical protein
MPVDDRSSRRIRPAPALQPASRDSERSGTRDGLVDAAVGNFQRRIAQFGGSSFCVTIVSLSRRMIFSTRSAPNCPVSSAIIGVWCSSSPAMAYVPARAAKTCWFFSSQTRAQFVLCFSSGELCEISGLHHAAVAPHSDHGPMRPREPRPPYCRACIHMTALVFGFFSTTISHVPMRSSGLITTSASAEFTPANVMARHVAILIRARGERILCVFMFDLPAT